MWCFILPMGCRYDCELSTETLVIRNSRRFQRHERLDKGALLALKRQRRRAGVHSGILGLGSMTLVERGHRADVQRLSSRAKYERYKKEFDNSSKCQALSAPCYLAD